MASKSTGSRKRSSTGGRPTPGGGRVTPKGGHHPRHEVRPTPRHDHDDAGEATDWSAASSRYTAPHSSGPKASPPWWPVLLFGLLGVGILLIVLDYTGALPGTPNNWMLLPAVACIAGGLVAAMSYR